MKRIHVSLALCACLLGGAAFGQDKKGDTKRKAAAAPYPSFKHLDGQTLVFVGNGSGGSLSVSDTLIRLAIEEHVPLLVHPIKWCRYGELAKDHADLESHFSHAARTAEWIAVVRQECPRSPVFLVGHSSGTHVILRTAEMLPENSVERIILLAPSVSCNYDLTRALRTSRGGVLSFWSNADGVLELAAELLGSADGQKTACAGRVGFLVPKEMAAKEPALYAKLSQVHWEEGIGGAGGHYGWTRAPFARRYLVPALTALKASPAPAPVKK
jgi:pimeloyl-ACP methyl ester carboxylesterase